MVDEADSKSVGVTLVWVRVPPPAPYKDGYFDTNNRPYFLPLYPQIAYLSVFSQKEGVLGGISSAVDALFLLFIDFWLKG